MMMKTPNEGMDTPLADGPSEIRLEDLSPDLRTACEHAGWPSLVPVQAKAIPYLFPDAI